MITLHLKEYTLTSDRTLLNDSFSHTLCVCVCMCACVWDNTVQLQLQLQYTASHTINV